jgi:hypothetical protein
MLLALVVVIMDTSVVVMILVMSLVAGVSSWVDVASGVVVDM